MDLRRLDLNLLVVMDALLSDPNVTNVARRLKVTQPAVSLSLGKLRTLFSDELFVRAPTGMRPTPFAKQLREPIRRAIEIIEIEVLQGRQFEPATTRQVFRISLSDAGESAVLPTLLGRLSAEAPTAAIQCLAFPPGRLAASMENGEVDVALGYFPDLATASFFRQGLYRDEVVCLVRNEHPLIKDSLSIEQFLQCAHAIVSHEGRGQDLFEKLMRDLGLERRIQVRLAHLVSVPMLIATSNLIAVVPRAVAAPYANIPELKILPPPMRIPPLEIKLYWHRRAHRDPPVVWLRKVVAECFLGKDPSIGRGAEIFNRGATNRPKPREPSRRKSASAES